MLWFLQRRGRKSASRARLDFEPSFDYEFFGSMQRVAQLSRSPAMADRLSTRRSERRHRRRRWLIVLAICVLAPAFLWCLAFPLFAVEVRSVSADGSVKFTPHRINRFDLIDWYDGLKMAGISTWGIRRMIYGQDGVYFFTLDGHVYGLWGNEFGVPATVAKRWEWSGDPHEFPHAVGPSPGP
jgi:hypothetical protein